MPVNKPDDIPDLRLFKNNFLIFLRLFNMFTIVFLEEENESVSHEDVNTKLRQKELEESQKLVKFIADKFQSFGKHL
jgi:hypothetical protein